MQKLISVIALATSMISVTAFAVDPTSGIENFPRDSSIWKGNYKSSGCSGVPSQGTATLNIQSATYQDNQSYGSEVLFENGCSLQLDNVPPSFHGLDQPTPLN